jgi:DNA-directed RNA polymerase specialized sigma subunit
MKLTTRQQQVYDLRMKKLTHKEIGKLLKITEGTSRQLFHQAKIRKLFST